MSGIEVAGVVLGAIPLIIRSLEVSANVFGGGLTSQSKDLRRMQRQVITDSTRYQILIERLLLEVVDDERAYRMLDSPADEMWNDSTIQSGIRDLMGPAADDFIALCLILSDKLIAISRDLDQIYEKDSGRSKRLRLSVKPKELKQKLRYVGLVLGRLETLVDETLSTSIDALVPKDFIHRGTPEASSKAQEHATLLQQILSESKISGLDVFIYPLTITTGRSVSIFTLLFRRNTIETTSGSGWRKAIVEIPPPSNSKSHDTFGKSQNSQSQTNRPRVPVVHFKDSSPSPDPVTKRGAEVVWADSPTELDRHFYEAGYHISHEPVVCLTYPQFESPVTVKFRNSGDLHRVSLKDVLKIKPAFPLSATLSLALEVARSVFYVHRAGLIYGLLNSENVCFSKDSNKIVLGNLLLPLAASQPQSKGKRHPDKSEAPHNIKTNLGRAVLTLGIMLVEILLGQDVSRWSQGGDTISPETRKIAPAALNEVRHRWGSRCSNAVKSCLVDFDWTEDWKDTEEMFLELVLNPLEDMLRQVHPERSVPRAKIVLVEDWDRALNSCEDGTFPIGLTEDYIKTSDLRNQTVQQVFKDNTQLILASCGTIRWLNEALSNEVRNFDDVLRQVDQHFESITPPSLDAQRIEVLLRQCLLGISTIPQIFGGGEHSSPSRKELEELQIQLRVDTLELQSLLHGLQAPNSPTMSSYTSASGADSIFDGDSFTLSSRSSFVGGDEIDLQHVNSRGLASEILRALGVGLDPTPFRQARLEADDQDLSSELRQILETYCGEIQGMDEEDASLSQSSQNPWYQKACSMVLKETEFLIEQLVSICRGSTDAFTIQAPGSKSRDHDEEEGMVPAFAVMDLLVDGKAFGRLRMRIRRLVKQCTMEMISDEVERSLPLTLPGLYNALFHVRWDLFDYITNELEGSTDISQVLTVTGEGRNAYASRCVDYLNWRWPDSKYDICSHIQQYLEHKTYEHPDATLMIDENKEGHSGITVNVVGSKETITEVAQQLAWLTAAFRSDPVGVALSDVEFIATKGMQFFIEPGALTNVSDVPSGPDVCWHRLVRNVGIAHEFPIPPRSSQVGLELPYAAMLKLSQVSTLLVSNRRLAFYGYSSFLFPRDQCSENNDSDQAQQLIQWHFEASDDPEQYFDGADYLAESKRIWANDVQQRTLATSRHFVGFCRVADFRLATATSNFLNLQESHMPEASTTLGARVENVTLGTGGLGFATAEVETNIRYAHNIVNAVAADEYLGILDTTEKMSMILWDCGDECGWLVPAQALLLHMAHVWVNSKGITANFRYASRGPGYLQEVDTILREDRREILRAEGRDDNSDFELRHLIMRMWNDIRGCMLAQQSALREDQGVIGYQASGISGWELTDFLTRPALEFSMKQDKRGPSDKSWKALAAEKNIPVLFCQGAGDVIKTTPPGLICANCRLSLKQENYLIASLSCLGNMAKKYGGFKAKTRLTAEWGWQPTDEVALFQEHCQLNVGSRCTERLQKLITVKEEQHGTTLNLPLNGVVVFGRAGSKASEVAVPGSAAGVATTPPVGKRRMSKWLAKLRKK